MPIGERRCEASPGIRMTCGSVLCGLVGRRLAAGARDGCRENKSGGSSSSASPCLTKSQGEGRCSSAGPQPVEVRTPDLAPLSVSEEALTDSGRIFQSHKTCGQSESSRSTWISPTTQRITRSSTPTVQPNLADQKEKEAVRNVDEASTESGASTKSSLGPSEDPKLLMASSEPSVCFMVPILEDSEIYPAARHNEISSEANDRHGALAVCDGEAERRAMKDRILFAVARAAAEYRSSPGVRRVRKHVDENEVVLVAQISQMDVRHQAQIMNRASKAFVGCINEATQLRVSRDATGMTDGLLRVNYVIVHVGLDSTDGGANHRNVSFCFDLAASR